MKEAVKLRPSLPAIRMCAQWLERCLVVRVLVGTECQASIPGTHIVTQVPLGPLPSGLGTEITQLSTL